MKTRQYLFAISAAVLLILVPACQNIQDPALTEVADSPKVEANLELDNPGRIVVANRASGSISVIDAATDQVSATYDLPAAENPAEPMYVVWSVANRRVFVGDRANNRVVAYNTDDFSVAGTAPTGEGVFHMWADFRGASQLWVNNDTDHSTTVIDPSSLTVIATVPTPADLVALGGIPHDVIVEPKGRFAYISVIGVEGDSDYVVQFDTRTFTETNRAAVGNDPHLSLSPKNRNLYVPCQGNSTVYVFNLKTLAELNQIHVDNAHGAAMTLNGETFYTTNIAGSGTGGLVTVDTQSESVLASTDTPVITPHNIALAPQRPPFGSPEKLFITHSGATADQVSVYDVSNVVPVFLTTVTVGLNPFGLAYIQ